MKISTGIVIPVERDGQPVGEFRFDPSDVAMAERFYDLIGRFEERQAYYEEQEHALDEDQTRDRYGIPTNAREKLALRRTVCEDVMAKIDEVFGAGVSEMVFGGTRSFDALEQFFDGLRPHMEQAQAERIRKYTNREQRRALKK